MESKKQEVMLFEFVVYIQAKAQEQELPLAPRSFVLPFQAVTAFSIVTKIVDWIAYFENFPSQASFTFPTIPRPFQRANRTRNRNHRQGIVPKLVPIQTLLQIHRTTSSIIPHRTTLPCSLVADITRRYFRCCLSFHLANISSSMRRK